MKNMYEFVIVTVITINPSYKINPFASIDVVVDYNWILHQT